MGRVVAPASARRRRDRLPPAQYCSVNRLCREIPLRVKPVLECGREATYRTVRGEAAAFLECGCHVGRLDRTQKAVAVATAVQSGLRPQLGAQFRIHESQSEQHWAEAPPFASTRENQVSLKAAPTLEESGRTLAGTAPGTIPSLLASRFSASPGCLRRASEGSLPARENQRGGALTRKSRWSASCSCNSPGATTRCSCSPDERVPPLPRAEPEPWR